MTFDIRKTGFYPPMYSESQDPNIQATIDVCNWILELFLDELESILQKWTLTQGVDSHYAQQICDYLDVPYVDERCFTFMKAKKTPANAENLQKVLVEVFPEFQRNISVVQIDTHHVMIRANFVEEETYTLFYRFLPFFQKYLPWCIPVGTNVQFDLSYQVTIHDLEIAGITVQQLQTYTIQQIRLFTEIPTGV